MYIFMYMYVCIWVFLPGFLLFKSIFYYITFIEIVKCSSGPCEHNCTDGLNHYTCSCQDGFVLAADGHSCYGQHTCIYQMYIYVHCMYRYTCKHLLLIVNVCIYVVVRTDIWVCFLHFKVCFFHNIQQKLTSVLQLHANMIVLMVWTPTPAPVKMDLFC